MDRLTDRTRNHGIYLTGQNMGATGYVPDDVLKRLADLEDILFAPDGTQRITLKRLSELVTAEQDGRCVVLPCKVGTRVWVIRQNCDLCCDMYAEEPCLFGSCEYKEVFESVFRYGTIDNFGKTVFLTREEAEAALKEGKP